MRNYKTIETCPVCGLEHGNLNIQRVHSVPTKRGGKPSEREHPTPAVNYTLVCPLSGETAELTPGEYNQLANTARQRNQKVRT